MAASYGLHPVDAKEKDLIEEVKETTKGIGSDVVFEVAGNQITADQMIGAIKTQGEIMVVSVYKKPPMIDLAKCILEKYLFLQRDVFLLKTLKQQSSS